MSETSEFRKELERLINRNNLERGSDTSDHILAEYLIECLAVFDAATKKRDQWYGRGGLSEIIDTDIKP